MDLRNKWFVKQLSTQQFSGGHFTAEKRGHFAVEWWGHLRAELVGHYPRILQLAPTSKSWTIVILENLKEKVRDLKLGRLKWVLSTSMPINPSFKLFLNKTEVVSSKLSYTEAVKFKVSEISPKRLETLNQLNGDNWSITGGRLKSNTFANGIEGDIVVTERTLLGGKSAEIGRSHGFFIKVRGRVINQDDETFGSVPTKFGTFNRMHAVIEADDLDQVLTASRENLENSKHKDLFKDLLNELLNEATSRFANYTKERELPQQRKKEGERNFVNNELMEFSIADTLSFQPFVMPKGAEPDNSFFYIDFGLLKNKDDLIKEFYSDKREKFKFDYLKNDRAERLVKFDVATRTFWINENHDFIKANIDNGSSKNLIEDFVAAEAMLEIYMIESGIPNKLAGEVLEKRDRLLRGLAHDHPVSLKFLADSLRDSSSSDLELEINHVIAIRALGFTAKHIAGPGKPDGLADFNTYEDGIKTITLESKSSIGTPGLSQLDFAGLHEHMKEYNALGCMLLAPSYPGQSKSEDSAAATRATHLKISCWTIEQLARILEESESRKISSRDIMKIVQEAFTPDEVTAAVEGLLSKTSWTFNKLYETIIKAIESLEKKLIGSLRTLDSIATAITFIEPEMSNISKDQVEEALVDISHISMGALIYRGKTVILNTSIPELRQRVMSHTGTVEASRKNGNFK